MDAVPGWNASRPTNACRSIIQGIIKSVLNLHQSGSRGCSHGNLRHAENYYLSCMHESCYGMRVQEYDVELAHRAIEVIDDRPLDLVTDMNDVLDLLMIILGINSIKDLPILWQDFFKKIHKLTTVSFAQKVSKDDKLRQCFFAMLKDHPALWGFRTRMNFYDCLYTTLKEEGNLMLMCGPTKLFAALQSILSTLNSVAASCWKRIPAGTVYSKLIPQRNNPIGGEELLRYIRNLQIHLFEIKIGHQGPYMKYFCSGYGYYHDLVTKENYVAEYNEVVMCEIFSNFLARLHEELIEKTWPEGLF